MRKKPPTRLVLLLGLAALTGVMAHGRPVSEPVPPGEPPYLTVFLIDGLCDSVFRKELAAGHLPNIATMIAEGTYIENGIASFPSMTGYGFYPFLTGLDAAESGILGLRWFDRDATRGPFRNYVGATNVQMNRDLSRAVPTLFERFPGQYTATINSFMSRGADETAKGGFTFFFAKYRDLILPDAPAHPQPPLCHVLPDWREAENRVLRLAVRQLDHRPKVHWITFAMPDGYQHIHGTRGEYPAIIRHLDGLIGEYREANRERGMKGQRIYALVSDHGVEDTNRNLDLTSLLRELGLRATRDIASRLWSAEFTEPAARYADIDAVVAVNGNKLGFVYFREPGAGSGSGPDRRHRGERPGTGWKSRPALSRLRSYPTDAGAADLLQALLESPGVELVITRDGNGGVLVLGEAGKAVITRGEGGYAYRFSGTDPLGYGAVPQAARLADGAFHPGEAWLRATVDSEFPDAVVRLHALLESEACGDVVVTARDGYDFGLDFEPVIGNYRGGHGGLRRNQIVVPYILCGPGVRGGARLVTARAEDVGATLQWLLGKVLEDGGCRGSTRAARAGRVMDEALADRASRPCFSS